MGELIHFYKVDIQLSLAYAKKYFGATFADTMIFLSFFHYCLALRIGKSLSKGIFLFIVIVREPVKHKGTKKPLRIDEEAIEKLIKQRTNV